MDAHLDTFSTELNQVNTYVSHIARQQACMGGFVASPSPSRSPETSEDENDDDGPGDDDDNDEDKDASSSSDDKMTSQ